MDELKKYQEIVKNIISEYAKFKPFYGEIENETVFDTEGNHYLLVHIGWKNGGRVHGSIIHVDIIDSKVWIQYDGTEDGIALELEEEGIPKGDILPS